MAEKKMLSNEVEEQIQSLASDVYIQIEEKLTQLICTVTKKESAKKIDIKEDPVYLALQHDYQTSQNELTEKNKSLSEQTHQLEQNTSLLKKQLDNERTKQASNDVTLKKRDTDSTTKIAQLSQENIKIKQQLADEKDKQEGRKLNYQVELTQTSINFTETIERLEHENRLLKSALVQEQQTLSSEQQSLKTELNEKTAELSQTIENLEQELSEQRNQLHHEQNQAKANIQQSQNQIVSNEKELLNKHQEIVVLNESLAASTEQYQSLNERLNATVSDLAHTQAQHQQQVNSFKQKSSQLNEQLQHYQINEESQHKVIADQQVQMFDFEEEIKLKRKEGQDFKQVIKQLNNEQSQIKQQQLTDKKENDVQEKQHQQAQKASQQKINQLEIKSQELTSSLITEKADIKLYQKEVSALKSQVTLAQEGYENILNRFNTNREKQEKDNDQVRETIKYLRDENNDMITQINQQKEGFIERTSELEQQLIEYRLKFEYAQKQLTQNS